MIKWIKKLFKKSNYHLGTTSEPRPFPNKLESSPLEKLTMVTELMGGIDHCPECGQEIGERPALINKEQALELLGFKPNGDKK